MSVIPSNGIVMPRPLAPGDLIRFVSPASSPDRADVEASARLLEGWGFRVDFGPNAFNRLNYLAGTDEERLSDLNAALRDPDVRAILATRGGKGSYRIANALDFAAARKDPKFLVGFSDITILQMALFTHGVGGAIHGALGEQDWTRAQDGSESALKRFLCGDATVTVKARADEQTSALTTHGKARGLLIGGNLDMIGTAAGWALPNVKGRIVLIEAVNMYLGQVDRLLTMLANGGHLQNAAGIAVGQFTDFRPSGTLTIVDLLRDYLTPLGVPILGGLPLGHGQSPEPIPLGRPTVLDADSGELRVEG